MPDEFFSRKAKMISGNFQQRAIFLWLLSGACPALDAGIAQKKVTYKLQYAVI